MIIYTQPFSWVFQCSPYAQEIWIMCRKLSAYHRLGVSSVVSSHHPSNKHWLSETGRRLQMGGIEITALHFLSHVGLKGTGKVFNLHVWHHFLCLA